jgi:predicted heme/steroid binding protein
VKLKKPINWLLSRKYDAGECVILEDLKKFSLNELKGFDGKGGKPAYVGYKGKVYDVTGSAMWGDGDHMGHAAGMDLTLDMKIAPHADDVMEKMKVVGVLAAP